MVMEEQANYKTGWISVYRSIFNHWIAPNKRPFTDMEAWLFILLNVNHSDKKIKIGNSLIECRRGESINSLDTWAKSLNWNKSKVRRFFNLLEKDSMIVTKNIKKTTHLTVCKYDSYQVSRNNNETQVKHKRNVNETIMTPNNNVNNYNNENNEINISFDVFWNLYDKKVDKVKSEKKWIKLTNEEREKIISFIPLYKKSQPDVKYRKNPITFFNNESWNDEIEFKEVRKTYDINNY